jgi:protein-disulfide isomerase
MTTRTGNWVSALILLLVVGQTAYAQSSDDARMLGREIEALKAGQAALQKELQDIRNLLQQAAQPAAAAARVATAEAIDTVLSIEGAPFKGDAAARVTVVEFTDYQCPFCSRHFRQTWPQLEQDFVKTGKAKFVLRDLPIEAIHPQAFKAAEAASCAGEQGRFWEMHDRLFANQSTLGRKDLSAHAQALGLDNSAFDSCLDSGKGAAKIRKDVADSERLGARGTPIFFLGVTDPGSSQLKAVRLIRGAHAYATFKEAIESLLAAAK